IGYACHRILCDEDGMAYDYEFVEVNKAFERITGLKALDIIGTKASEVLSDKTGNDLDWLKTCREMAFSGESKEIEEYSPKFHRWYRTFVSSPERGYFITWIFDISKEMRDPEEKNILLTSVNDIIFELDEDYTFRSVLIADEVSLFIPRNEVIGIKIDALFPEELASKLLETFKKAALSGQKKNVRYKSPYHNDDRWLEAEIFTWRTHVVAKGYIASIREVTEQKKLEDALLIKTEELEKFFELNPDLLCIADFNGNIIKINNACERILGYPVNELLKKSLLDLVITEDLKTAKEVLNRLCGGEKVLNYVNGCKCMDGSVRYIEWCSQPHNGIIYTTGRDITERRQTEEALRLSEERLNVAMKAARAGLWDWNMKNDTIYYSPMWRAILGYEQDEIDDTYEAWSKLWHPEDVEMVRKAIKDYIKGESSHFEVTHRIKDKSGNWRWTLARGELARDEKGEPGRLTGTNIDITGLKEAEKEIRYLSFHDQLTGLYNRRFYEEELKRLDTMRNLPISLIMVDINGLKLANDAFGHTLGDRLLKKAAEAIKLECRSDEIVSRIGGDEFVVILPGTDSLGAEMLAKRIKNSVFAEKVDMLDLSISLGWATKTHPGEAMEDIFNKAEDNMYRRKLVESPETKEKAVQTIINGLWERLPEERTHSKRVSRLCESIAEELGFSREEIETIKEAAMLHDIGYITLNEAILEKPGKLDDHEWIEVKRHSEKGYLILSSVNRMAQQAKFVLHHHEHWDGSGYPNSLKGGSIPLGSRIIGIGGSYDAMICDRAYRKALSKEEAISEIAKNSGKLFDPELARLFTEGIVV
ncbi:MAG TPA: PAS domain S-box protein, partial [Negativicutes bacterium]|nr:PAS domain S-box protein [Negativicutes bacterium]